MYKTVRKGDASLQYTILPQTDQFNAAGLPQPLTKSKDKVGVKCLMVLLVVVVMGSCVALPFLIDPNGKHSLKSSSKFRTSRVDDPNESAPGGSEKGSEGNLTSTERRANEERRNKHQGADYLSPANKSKIDGNKSWDEEEEAGISEGTTAPSEVGGAPPFGGGRNGGGKNGGGAEEGPSGGPKGGLGPGAAAPASSGPGVGPEPPSPAAPTKGGSEGGAAATEAPRALPRVTLKLRENETIPQMYMKAGIASYKKGNITTSVLAHGLSLEGLIFKTPEGTIKPWPQKWPFADPASYFQWKGIRQVPRVVYFVILGFAGLATTGIILMTYIQWRASSRRQRGNLQVLEIESQEEDESTLLGPEMATETMEKE